MKLIGYCITATFVILLVISAPKVLSAQELECHIEGPYWPLSAPNHLNFNLSVTGGVQPYNYTFIFGDGTPDESGAVDDPEWWLVFHIYPSVGLYNAMLTVTDAIGNSCHSFVTVYVVGVGVKESSWGAIKSTHK